MERSTNLTPVTSQFGGPQGIRAPGDEALRSGVSWAAVIAGAFVTAAMSLILLSLGTGLGLASVSPWRSGEVSASALGAAAIIGLILLQLIPSAFGGYLAGRLRTKWVSIHSDEVYFRDTAHGFLSWAVSVVLTAAFLASAAATMTGSTTPSSSATNATTTAERATDPNAYFVDMLFRSDHPQTNGNDSALRAESARILANALRQTDVPPPDRTYLAQMISAQTGMSPTDAGQRVDSVVTQARQAADSARKTAVHVSLWIFISLLIGAFSASFAATIGGRQRDHVVTI